MRESASAGFYTHNTHTVQQIGDGVVVTDLVFLDKGVQRRVRQVAGEHNNNTQNKVMSYRGWFSRLAGTLISGPMRSVGSQRRTSPAPRMEGMCVCVSTHSEHSVPRTHTRHTQRERAGVCTGQHSRLLQMGTAAAVCGQTLLMSVNTTLGG